MNDVLHEPCSVGELILRAIQRGGDRIAFISEGRQYSYAEFGRQLSCVIQALEDLGLGRGRGIACLAPNRFKAFLIVAAAHVAGLRLTNLHPLGSADDQSFILGDSEVSALVFDPGKFGDRARELASKCPGVSLLGLGESDLGKDILALAGTKAPQRLVAHAQADDLCLLAYTGGTTGKPKGVMLTHRTYAAAIYAELSEWEWPSRTVFLTITPISHGAGTCMLPVLMRSGTIVLESEFTPAAFFDVVKRYNVTSTFLVPTMIYKLLDAARDNPQPSLPLEMVIYGAAPISPARLAEAIDVFGSIFLQLYGQTEAPNCISVLRKIDHDPVARRDRASSCGFAIAASQVALLDDEGKSVKQGQVGEICVRGPIVMSGYWKRPEETESAFRHGWLHTGDLAYQDEDGFLFIVGRSKDMIITGGFNIYPSEVEDALTAHPAVSAATVFGVPDNIWGEAVHALVVLKPGHQAASDELRLHVRQAKGAAAAPKRIDFADSIPLTSLGKPDKKSLRERNLKSASLEAAHDHGM